MRPVLLLWVVLLSVGCGAKGYHIATVSVVTAHSTASVIQDTADAFLCQPGEVPGISLPCISSEQRKALAGKLSPTFGLTGRLAATIKAWPPGTPMPIIVSGLLGQITALLNDALALLPASAQARIRVLVEGQ